MTQMIINKCRVQLIELEGNQVNETSDALQQAMKIMIQMIMIEMQDTNGELTKSIEKQTHKEQRNTYKDWTPQLGKITMREEAIYTERYTAIIISKALSAYIESIKNI